MIHIYNRIPSYDTIVTIHSFINHVIFSMSFFVSTQQTRYAGREFAQEGQFGTIVFGELLKIKTAA
jgi:hypothetical protein